MFSGDRYGLINYWLMDLGIINEPFLWLQNIKTIMPVLIIVSLWMSMGISFLAFLA
jgi:multiple sugar transport system permease protein